MIKHILASLALTSAPLVTAVSAAALLTTQTAYAQTTQTDKSEDDWRKSRKKKTSKDIFDPILGKGGTGIGSLPPLSPVDTLPEDSKRHLKRMRAQIIADSDPGKTPDYSYKPSSAAQSDPDLEQDEQRAWEHMTASMKQGQGGTGKSAQGQPGQGQSGMGQPGQGQSPHGPAGQTGAPQQGSASSGQNGNSPSGISPMRGGSSSSAASILAQIKGLTSGAQSGIGQTPSGTSPLGQSPSGQPPAGQSTAGQSPSGQSPSGQGQAANGQNQSPSGTANDTNAQASAQAQGDAQAQAQAQAQGEAQAAGAGDPQAAVDTSKTAREKIGPLDRLKSERRNNPSGSRSSASDFLKKSRSGD